MSSPSAVQLFLAHAGHWYFFPLYAAPVVIVLWSAIATARRERRSARDEQDRGGDGAQRN